VVEQFFDRYDLDASGTINSERELQQLTTNLIVRLRIVPTKVLLCKCCVRTPRCYDQVNEVLDKVQALIRWHSCIVDRNDINLNMNDYKDW
jgi:hypothetical protein